jgi:hypothetical protein
LQVLCCASDRVLCTFSSPFRSVFILFFFNIFLGSPARPSSTRDEEEWQECGKQLWLRLFFLQDVTIPHRQNNSTTFAMTLIEEHAVVLRVFPQPATLFLSHSG